MQPRRVVLPQLPCLAPAHTVGKRGSDRSEEVEPVILGNFDRQRTDEPTDRPTGGQEGLKRSVTFPLIMSTPDAAGCPTFIALSFHLSSKR